MTLHDFLLISGIFSILLLTLYICWLLYQLIAILRDVREITSTAKTIVSLSESGAQKLVAIIEFAQAKITSRAAETVFDTVSSLVQKLSEKQQAKKRKNRKFSKKS